MEWDCAGGVGSRLIGGSRRILAAMSLLEHWDRPEIREAWSKAARDAAMAARKAHVKGVIGNTPGLKQGHFKILSSNDEREDAVHVFTAGRNTNVPGYTPTAEEADRLRKLHGALKANGVKVGSGDGSEGGFFKADYTGSPLDMKSSLDGPGRTPRALPSKKGNVNRGSY